MSSRPTYKRLALARATGRAMTPLTAAAITLAAARAMTPSTAAAIPRATVVVTATARAMTPSTARAMTRATVVVTATALTIAAANCPNAFGQDQNSSTGGTANSAPIFDATADARQLFSSMKLPADMPLSSIGTYTNGCIAGAVALPLEGEYYRVMRPSRNRYWGHPRTMQFLTELAEAAHKHGWHGLLVGDISMPRGGPMPRGHASHQIGLDVDIWLTPLPRRKLTSEDVETMEAGSVLKIDSAELDRRIWTTAHANFVREAARSKNVARIFVTPAIKKELCMTKRADGSDAWWLSRLRPCHEGVCEGHDDHIHVRLNCLEGDCNCQNQEPVNAADDGCGDELTEALKEVALHPPYTSKSPQPETTKAPFPLSKMPPQAVDVLKAPNKP